MTPKKQIRSKERSESEKKKNIEYDQAIHRDNWSENMKPINPYYMACVLISGVFIVSIIIFLIIWVVKIILGV